MLFRSSIGNSRCPAGLQCIWQGELAPVFSFMAPNTDIAQDVRLGTVTRQTAALGAYTLTLEDATVVETTFTVVVSGVSGQVLMGPTCPVVRASSTQDCSDHPYVNADVVLLHEGTGAVVGESMTDDAGKFLIVIAPGTYTVAVSSSVVYPRCSTETVTVSAAFTSTVAINCDSGIR